MQTSWIPFVPESASTISSRVDALYFYLSGVTVFFTLLISLTLIIFVIKYRRRSPFEIPRPVAGSHKLETLWTVIPLLIAMSMFGWGAQLYFENSRPPKNSNEIYVVGKQWMWKIQHPEGNREINELHIPEGRNIKLTLASQDVIHSFFLPAFRIKQDIVPGRYTTEWFNADKVGTYYLFCSEYCGTHHSAMKGRVVVMNPTDYEQWLSKGGPANTLAQSGAKLYRELGCSGCHDGSTIVRAPPLAGVFGKPVPLQNGTFVTADEGYLRDSILLPAKDIAAGYTNDMPSFQGRVSEEELMELIAYLRSLGNQASNGGGR